LRQVPHVLTVRVTRAFDKRVDWLMDKLGTDDRAFAEAEVRRSDSAHSARMHALYDVTWGDPLLYDMVINMDRVSIDSAVATIRRWRRARNSPRRRIDGDAGRPRAGRAGACAAQGPRSHARLRIDIGAQGDKVVLAGIVLIEQERAAERVATIAVARPRDNGWVMVVNRRFASTDARL
jgi:hypothetical protein